MQVSPIQVTRIPVRLGADARRVISRPFIPGGDDRVDAVLDRVLALSDAQVANLMADIRTAYAPRHKDIDAVFNRHYSKVAPRLDGRAPKSVARRQLVGAYFTMEYSLESVALFNPSMVLHCEQGGVAEGRARFIMSLRACGEGHISSIVFRTGQIGADDAVTFDAAPRFAITEQPDPQKLYDRARFFRKLIEMGVYNPLADGVIKQLEPRFTIDDLGRAIDALNPDAGYAETFRELTRNMMWLVNSNYHLIFPAESELSERVIFPVTENESRGIEDARFVRFTDDDGGIKYYATYTAYNGFRVLPQFLETTDFRHFKIYTLNGRCVQNKGMALFPRRIDGWYYMVSRLDGENIYMLRSDNVHFWNESHMLRTPVEPWEFVQIGNCGSPIETEHGWLLLTHGVGPLRQYWLGALLLDLQAPTRVIGHLAEPMLVPLEDERDGYVPNVIYSCGGMVYGDRLFIPYAIADSCTSIATVSLPGLLSHLRAD